MKTDSITVNPFALMMEPDVVLKAMDKSKSLRGLHHHKHSPLDKPLIPFRTAEEAKLAAERAAKAVPVGYPYVASRRPTELVN